MSTEEAERIWQRFDAEVTDDLLRAVSGAFAFIACADAHLDDREVERFLAWVGEHPAFAALDRSSLEARFRELAEAFREDFEEGERRATEAIARVRGSEHDRDLVLRAAQIAVVADERLEAVEEAALGHVCAALGVEPGGW